MRPKTSITSTTIFTMTSKLKPFFLFIILLFTLFSLYTLFSNSNTPHSLSPQQNFLSLQSPSHIKVYIANLPRSFNYGLLNHYWSSPSDSRIPQNDAVDSSQQLPHDAKFPPYPRNPLIQQYSAEYWILGDLMTHESLRAGSFAKRVMDSKEADVVFVPFFATLSAEMQLAKNKGMFGKKVEENEDYRRQKEVVEFVKGTEEWKRSGGRDHVFVLTDPVAMWHVRAEIAPAILLVVDFGGWYKLDSKSSKGNSSEMIQHTQVSLLKDVIVPYTHLLPRLQLSENQERHTLLYFKGAKHRHRGGIVREKLWELLVNEPGVIMEEGFPNATGREQSIRGMRTSEFCLHPAGDTPTSCRLFDAIQSLCIPVIVSDNIELPFEGIVDYSEFSVFVAVSNALRPKWLVNYLKSITKKQRDLYRRNMAQAQPIFKYDNGHPDGLGPIPPDGAVNHIWRKVHQKLPMIKEAIVRERRKPQGVQIPLRCHCT